MITLYCSHEVVAPSLDISNKRLMTVDIDGTLETDEALTITESGITVTYQDSF